MVSVCSELRSMTAFKWNRCMMDCASILEYREYCEVTGNRKLEDVDVELVEITMRKLCGVE